MNDTLNKNNKKIIGSIIRINRINQNMSQKTLCKGICVPSYLSRIENGDLIPSEDVLSIIFNRLGLTYNDSEEFIKKGQEAFKTFFKSLNFNEFDFTNELFAEIEAKENEYITSVLIIDYFLAKLARYCSTPERDKFEDSKNILLSAFDLLSPHQKFLYNFYVGVDILNLSEDKLKGKEYIQNALEFTDDGHCFFWLSYSYRLEGNVIKAYECIKKALDIYVTEGNIVSIMNSYEKIAEVYFMLNNYNDSVYYLNMSLNVAEKLKNQYFIEHVNSMIAWAYYKMKEYKTALDYLTRNCVGVIDHRMVIPDSLVECLIYFELKDKESLLTSLPKLKNPQTLEHLNETLANTLYKFFKFYIEDDNYLKSHIWEGLLIYISDSIYELVELKKIFNSLLKEFYIYNRRYKDALNVKDL